MVDILNYQNILYKYNILNSMIYNMTVLTVVIWIFIMGPMFVLGQNIISAHSGQLLIVLHHALFNHALFFFENTCERVKFVSRKNLLAEMNTASKFRSTIKAKRNKRRRSAAVATNVSQSQQPSNHQHQNLVSPSHQQSSSKSNSFNQMLEPAIDTNAIGESFDLMKIPYAPIQPTFDYYLANDHFPAANSSDDLDDSIKQV